MDSGDNRFVLSLVARSIATRFLNRGDWRQILEITRVTRERRFRAHFNTRVHGSHKINCNRRANAKACDFKRLQEKIQRVDLG
jgi:hypothetical protein